MKLTKLTMNLLAVALLLVTASAVRAAETGTAPKLDTAQQAPALESSGTSCSTDGQSLVAADGQEPVPMAFNTCGSCSTDGCAGALRGSLCYTGTPQGWGYCDIYEGSNLCPRGGLDCSCGTGPIP